MSAIESCRTAALGGHVARCEKCSHTLITYLPQLLTGLFRRMSLPWHSSVR
jgi:hypothetical protein